MEALSILGALPGPPSAPAVALARHSPSPCTLLAPSPNGFSGLFQPVTFSRLGIGDSVLKNAPAELKPGGRLVANICEGDTAAGAFGATAALAARTLHRYRLAAVDGFPE